MHVELVSTHPQEQLSYEVDADERGLFKVPAGMVGEYRMRISSPGFKAYETTPYIPADLPGQYRRDPEARKRQVAREVTSAMRSTALRLPRRAHSRALVSSLTAAWPEPSDAP